MYALLQVYNMLNIYILKFIYWALSYELTINSTIVYIVNRLLSPLAMYFVLYDEVVVLIKVSEGDLVAFTLS